jgi:membrane protease YdiL (CAAX protease family)
MIMSTEKAVKLKIPHDLNCGQSSTFLCQLRSTTAALSILVALYIVPTVAIALGIIPYKHRFTALYVIFLIAVYISYRQHLSLAELGFSRPPLLWFAAVTVIPIATLYFLVVTKILPPISGPKVGSGFLLFFICLSAPTQEFIYRSFLFAQLRSVVELGALGRILCSALLYGLMHIIYRDLRTVVLTTAIGLLWAWCYEQTGNLLIVTVSHMILGVVALSLNII